MIDRIRFRVDCKWILPDYIVILTGRSLFVVGLRRQPSCLSDGATAWRNVTGYFCLTGLALLP